MTSASRLRPIAALLSLPLLAFAVASAGAATTWESPERLSVGEYGDDADLAVNADGDAIVAWEAPLPGGGLEISHSYRPVGGVWSAPSDVDTTALAGSLAENPSVAIDPEGDALIAWEASCVGGGSCDEIRVAERAASGTLTLPVDLTPAGSGFVRRRASERSGGSDGAGAEALLDQEGNATVVFDWQNGSSIRPRVAERAVAASSWTSDWLIAPGAGEVSVRDLSIDESGGTVALVNDRVSGGNPGLSAVTRESFDDGWTVPQEIVSGTDPEGPGGIGLVNAGAFVAAHDDGRMTAVWNSYDGSGADPYRVFESVRTAAGAWGDPVELTAARGTWSTAAGFNGAGEGSIVLQRQVFDSVTFTSGEELLAMSRSAGGAWSVLEPVHGPSMNRLYVDPEVRVDDEGDTQLVVIFETGFPTTGDVLAFDRPAAGGWSAAQTISDIDRGGGNRFAYSTALELDGSGRPLVIYEDITGTSNPNDPDSSIVMAVDGDATGGGGPTDEGSEKGGSGPGGKPGSAPVGRRLPAGVTAVDSIRTAPMPNVVGLRADLAKKAVEGDPGGNGIYADFQVVETHKKFKNAGIGDVVAQSPRTGTPVTSSLGLFPLVKLTVYAGPVPKRGSRCPIKTLKGDLKRAEFDLAQEMLREQGCKLDFDVRIGGRGAEPSVGGISPDGKGAAEVDLSVPRDPAKHDLFISVREFPQHLSFIAGEWTLTAGEKNSYTVQVIDRAGRLVHDAEIVFDNRDVDAPTDTKQGRTDGAGQLSTVVDPSSAGKIEILAIARGSNEKAIYGVAQIEVESRSAKQGAVIETVTGKAYERRPGGWGAVAGTSASRAPRAAVSAANPFEQIAAWMGQLLKGFAGGEIFASAKPAKKQLQTAATTTKTFPAQLAVGGKTVGPRVGIISDNGGGLITDQGGAVKSNGGDNLIGDHGTGLVVLDGGALIGQAGGNVIASDGASVISADGASLIGQAGGNLIGQAGGNLIGQAGGNLVVAAKSGFVAVGNGAALTGTVTSGRAEIANLGGGSLLVK
jgi:hypothetical protein